MDMKQTKTTWTEKALSKAQVSTAVFEYLERNGETVNRKRGRKEVSGRSIVRVAK